MKKRLMAILAILFLGSILITQPVLADDVSHLCVVNAQFNCYGARADISTPSSAPSLSPSSCDSCWVQADGPNGNWVSTGWMFANGGPPYSTTNAQPVTEFGINGVDDQLLWGTQAWGSYANYKVTSNGSWWFLYINQILEYRGLTLISAPAQYITVGSEVNNSQTNAIYASFLNVSWLDSLGSWNYFNQNNFQKVTIPSNLYNPYYWVATNDHTYVCEGP
jgi:hypothetical protein